MNEKHIQADVFLDDHGAELQISTKYPPGTHPKISLVTPSLNQGQFIEETIQSVLSQNYPNLEYLVMDGGSSDQTLEILQRYSGQIVWSSEKDKGQANAINKGLRIASGDILAYLNADDLLLPGTLLKVAQEFLKHPDAMWVTGRCRIIDEKNREIRRLITAYKNTWLRMHRGSLLLITDYISQPATFWRMEAFQTLGLFDENFHYAMDYEYWLRMNDRFQPVIIPEYLAAFRIHHQSKNIISGHRDVYINEDRMAVERYAKSRYSVTLHDLHRWLMTMVYSVINRA